MVLMNRNSWIIICLAYIIGLLATGLFYFTNDFFSVLIIVKIEICLVVLGLILLFLLKGNSDRQVYFLAIAISLVAVIYFSFRLPQPQSNDISYLVTSPDSQLVSVTGKVLTEPRLNSNQKLKFWFQVQGVTTLEESIFKKVAGKLYVTLPLLEGNQIAPQDLVTIEGALYKPKAPINSQQFNFQRYLREEGAFASFTGFKVLKQSPSKWGWYKLRNRIVCAQVIGLDSPLGQLVSSMVLGQKAVDLPEDIRDLFVKGGLAHVLAASGFQVSLLLGIILRITKFLDSQKKIFWGCITLFIYACLTGFSPSIFRAVIMGFAVLIALINQAKVRSDGSLLLAATILLLINPLWIWDLGFQLSFLATLGLIVTLPPLEKKLDWLPYNLTTAIAIPLAASIWTLPLISYVFNTVATYSILVNIITTPLITIISLGGMLASVISLIIPVFGSYLGWLLKYPTLLLIALTKFFTNLPGNTWAIGEISLFVLLLIYGLIILIWFNRKLQQNWLPVLILIIGLIILPLRYQKANLLQVTILNTNNPTVVIQDKNKTILLNNGDAQDIKYTIMPFLASQGVNQLDYAIISLKQIEKNDLAIQKLQSYIKIKKLVLYSDRKINNIINKTTIPVEYNPTITTDSLEIQAINNSQALQLTINNQQWLITNQISSVNKTFSKAKNVLLWLGNELNEEILTAFSGETAIANKIQLSETTTHQSLQFYTTERHGIISWTPKTGFTTTLEAQSNNNF